MTTSIQDCSLIIEQAIQWGDMDSYEHINNAVYFRYFENARINYFHQTKVTSLKKEWGVGPILGETSCRYMAPLTFPDSIKIGTRVTHLRAKRFTMEYIIHSENLNRTVALGMGEIIFLDYKKGKTVEIPEAIRKEIIQMESDRIEIL